MGTPKSMWMEVVRIDLNKYNLLEDLAEGRLEWRNRTHVVNPNTIGTKL